MHAIQIPQHVIDWCIHRRGRRHVYEAVDPTSTALLVIDMQNCFIVPELSPVEVPGVAAIAPNINALAKATRDAGGTVIWTQHVYTPGWSSWFDHFAAPEMRERIIADTAVGSHGRKIWKGMDVQPADPVVVKTRSSALTPGSSNLKSILDAAGVDTLIVTGTLTNVCCESTTRDAMLMNYKTIFIADATGARSDDEHNATLVNMIQFFADVRMTEEVVDLLGEGLSDLDP